MGIDAWEWESKTHSRSSEMGFGCAVGIKLQSNGQCRITEQH